MTVGLSQVRDERWADRLDGMLLLPVAGRPGDYPVNRPGEESAVGPAAGMAFPGGATPGARSQARDRTGVLP
jgi:hypothetical protein